MAKSNKAAKEPLRQMLRKVNWKKALPFGTHIRETIDDLKLIRASLRQSHEPGLSQDEADATR